MYCLKSDKMDSKTVLSCKKCVFHGYKKCCREPENTRLWIRIIDFCDECIEQQYIDLEKMNDVYYPQRDNDIMSERYMKEQYYCEEDEF